MSDSDLLVVGDLDPVDSGLESLAVREYEFVFDIVSVPLADLESPVMDTSTDRDAEKVGEARELDLVCEQVDDSVHAKVKVRLRVDVPTSDDKDLECEIADLVDVFDKLPSAEMELECDLRRVGVRSLDRDDETELERDGPVPVAVIVRIDEKVTEEEME